MYNDILTFFFFYTNTMKWMSDSFVWFIGNIRNYHLIKFRCIVDSLPLIESYNYDRISQLLLFDCKFF